MESANLIDRFTLNSREYLLKTIDDVNIKRIVLRLYSEGKISYTSEVTYDDNTADGNKQQLIVEHHQRHKEELARLIGFHLAQNGEIQSRYLLANAFLKYGMFQEAIAELKFFLQAQPDSSHARIVLGKIYLKTKKYRLALDQFVQAVSVHEQYADLHFYCGVCLYYLGNCVEAVKCFTRTLKINPHYGEAHFYSVLTLLLNVKLAQEYRLSKRLTERALQLLAYSSEMLPLLKTESFEQGTQLIAGKKYEEAFEVLAPLAALLENGETGLFNYEFYLQVLLELEHLSFERIWQEISRLKELVERHPQYADLHYELGFAYAVLSTSVASKSISHLHKALLINPIYQNAQLAEELMKNEAIDLRAMVHSLLPVHL